LDFLPRLPATSGSALVFVNAAASTTGLTSSTRSLRGQPSACYQWAWHGWRTSALFHQGRYERRLTWSQKSWSVKYHYPPWARYSPRSELTLPGFSVIGQFFQNQAGCGLFPVKRAALIAPRV